VIGFLATVVFGLTVCRYPVGPKNLRQLDASAGASGPHVFAVRLSAVRQPAADRSQAKARPAITCHA
jgi:hypothetical protein